MKPWVAGVTAAALEESKGTELEEPTIVIVTTPASLTLRWESEKGLKVVYNVTGEGEWSRFEHISVFQCVNVIS